MEKSLKLGLISIILGVFTIFSEGCTRNNGDIGPLFGIWHLEKMDVDGAEDGGYDGNCFWNFQNNIICITVETDALAHAPERSWGTWSRQDKTLILDFSHKAGGGAQQGMYQPPAFLLLPATADVSLTVEREKGAEMVLSYITGFGEKITYHFKKY